jgi:hypothetical protein
MRAMRRLDMTKEGHVSACKKLLGDRGMERRLVMQIAHRLGVISFIAAVALVTVPAFGRDLDGRYKDSPLREWFNHLASQRGLCCSFADGYVVEDADWISQNGHYRVRVPKAASSKDMIWVEVPDEAVIKEPNKVGRTMVWPLFGSEGVLIRCFMPGSMI